MSGQVDVYAVGWLWALRVARGAVRHRRLTDAMGFLGQQARYDLQNIKAGHWRALKSSFNGYLAEPRSFPDELRRCGSGWTRARALRSLDRHMRSCGAR